MKKFSIAFLIILSILIIGGLGTQFFYVPQEQDAENAELDASENVPGYETMVHITKVASQQQLEAALLDIEIEPIGDHNNATVHFQSSEFMTEDTLLKDSYNMLVGLNKLEPLNAVTFVWHPTGDQNRTPILEFTLEQQALDQLAQSNYEDIRTLATSYQKNENVK